MATVAALELHRVDSLWSSLVERLTYKIEFYPCTPLPPSEGGWGLQNCIQESPEVLQCPPRERTLSPSPADPSAAVLGLSTFRGGNGGGFGPVKSIEITAERTEQLATARRADSASRAENHSAEAVRTEKASEARQDNGTVIGLAVVFAVALLVYLMMKEAMK